MSDSAPDTALAPDEPDEPEPLYRARLLALGGDHGAAIGILREFTAAHPEHSLAWRRLAAALIGADQPAEARQAADRAVELAPDDAAAHRIRGTALFGVDDFAGAAEAAEAATRLAPSDTEAHVVLAEALLRLPDGVGRAKTAIDQALTLDPYSRPAVVCARWIEHVRPAPTLMISYAVGNALALVLGFLGAFVLLGGLDRAGFLLAGAALAGLATSLLSMRLLRISRRHGRTRSDLLISFAAIRPPVVSAVLGVVAGSLVAGLVARLAGGTAEIQMVIAGSVLLIGAGGYLAGWSKILQARRGEV